MFHSSIYAILPPLSPPGPWWRARFRPQRGMLEGFESGGGGGRGTFFVARRLLVFARGRGVVLWYLEDTREGGVVVAVGS